MPTATAWYAKVPWAGHSPLTAAGPCGVEWIQAFLGDPTAEPAPGCEMAAPGPYSPAEFADTTGAAAP